MNTLLSNLLFLVIGLIGLFILWRAMGDGDKFIFRRPDIHSEQGRKILVSYLTGGPLILLAGIGSYINTISIQKSVIPALLSLIIVTMYAAMVIKRSK